MRVCGVYFVFVILLSACTNGVSHLDIALQQAKHNKAELEKVLKHFKHDSLKYRAACFLIENMPGKYSILPYDSLDRYKNFLKIIPQNDPISWDVDILRFGMDLILFLNDSWQVLVRLKI